MAALWEWIFLAMAATPVVAFVVLIWTIQEVRMATSPEDEARAVGTAMVQAFPALSLAFMWSAVAAGGKPRGWMVLMQLGMLVANIGCAGYMGWKARDFRALAIAHGVLSVLFSLCLCAFTAELAAL